MSSRPPSVTVCLPLYLSAAETNAGADAVFQLNTICHSVRKTISSVIQQTLVDWELLIITSLPASKETKSFLENLDKRICVLELGVQEQNIQKQCYSNTSNSNPAAEDALRIQAADVRRGPIIWMSGTTATDESGNIVADRRNCERNRTRFKILAFNHGLFHGRGRFIKFVEPGDELDKANLEVCVSAMNEHPGVTMLATETQIEIEKNNPLLNQALIFKGAHPGYGSNHETEKDSRQTTVRANAKDSYLLFEGVNVQRSCLINQTNILDNASSMLFRKSNCATGFDTMLYRHHELDLYLRVLNFGSFLFLKQQLHSEASSASARKADELDLFDELKELFIIGTRFKSRLNSFDYSLEEFFKLTLHKFQTKINELEFPSTNLPSLIQELTARRDHNLAELAVLRQILYISLLEYNTSKFIRPEQYTNNRQAIVNSLERDLKPLLRSDSWAATRPLREFKRALKRKNKFSDKTTLATGQIKAQEYAVRLREQIKHIHRSKSWQLTERMRQLGIMDKQLKNKTTHFSNYDSALFDADYYLSKLSSAYRAAASTDPLIHYMLHDDGDPHPIFSVDYYKSQTSTIAGNINNSLFHYQQKGFKSFLNPHPLFDSAYYDKQANLNASSCHLLHYIEQGARLGLDPHPWFDTSYYYLQCSSRNINVQNPLSHYLLTGFRLGLNPHPFFSNDRYLERNPDVKAMGTNPLLHYITVGKLEGRLARNFPNLNVALEAVSSQAMRECIETAKKCANEVSHILIVGTLSRGGAERSAISYYRAIAHKVGGANVLLIVTDSEAIACDDWLQPETKLFNLAGLNLSPEEKSILLFESIRLSQATTVIAFNSKLFWNSADTNLSNFRSELQCKLISYLGSFENYIQRNEWGFNEGPFSRSFENLDLILTDSQRMQDFLRYDRYKQVANIKTKVIHCKKSLMPELADKLLTKRRSEQASNRILWASRLDRVKRPDVLAQIAWKLPQLEFHVYGCSSLGTDCSYLKALPNVRMMGEYTEFSKIDTEQYALFLYTSQEDGYPHVLLEAAACGLPIVASNAGGVGEFINERTGCLISYDDVESFVDAINDALADYPAACIRANNAKECVEKEHNWDAYLKRVAALDIW